MVQAIYYPYGGILSQSTNQGVQKYKYNGKEYDTMHGLNMYDYGARQQDPAVGMFTSMDPLCEKYYNISPYMYCAGNPIRYVDPDGRDWVKVNSTGKYIYDENLTSANFLKSYNHKDYTYMGRTAETKDGRYLSLFGRNMDVSQKGTKLYQHIENAFINLEKARNGKEEAFEKFDIGISYKPDLWNEHKNQHIMEYEGANVMYTVMHSDSFNAMMGYVQSFMKKEQEKNGAAGGIVINIKQVKGGSSSSTIVRINFQDSKKAQEFLNKYNKEFGTNITIEPNKLL